MIRKTKSAFALILLMTIVFAMPVSAAAGKTVKAQYQTPIESAIAGAQPADAAEAAAREIAKKDLVDNLLKGLTAGQSLLTVGEGMTYPTISSAAAAAKDGDVILVFPGVYVESVDLRDKELSLVGVCREECFLQYPDDDYKAPPLQMSRGILMNMTVLVRDHQDSGASAKAYCLHVDDDRSENSSLSVYNCSFLSESYQAVGAGLRGNFALTFSNCLFYSGSNYAALFCHDWDTMDDEGNVLTGADKQRLILLNCELINEGPAPTLQLHSQEIPGNKAEGLFAMNKITNRTLPSNIFDCHSMRDVLTGNGFMGTSDWMLNVNSFGNSAPQLNVGGTK